MILRCSSSVTPRFSPYRFGASVFWRGRTRAASSYPKQNYAVCGDERSWRPSLLAAFPRNARRGFREGARSRSRRNARWPCLSSEGFPACRFHRRVTRNNSHGEGGFAVSSVSPGFGSHDCDSRHFCDAQHLRHNGEVIFRRLISEAAGYEQLRTFVADDKESRLQPARDPHGKTCVFLGVGQKISSSVLNCPPRGMDETVNSALLAWDCVLQGFISIMCLGQKHLSPKSLDCESNRKPCP